MNGFVENENTNFVLLHLKLHNQHSRRQFYNPNHLENHCFEVYGEWVCLDNFFVNDLEKCVALNANVGFAAIIRS